MCQRRYYRAGPRPLMDAIGPRRQRTVRSQSRRGTPMRIRRDPSITDRRSLLLNGMTLAGAAALAPSAAGHATADTSGPVQLAQAGPARAAPAVAALTVKSVERLAGSATSYAYAVKAGPFVFLNGHEAFDFEQGLSPDV